MHTNHTSLLSLNEKIGQLFFIGLPGDAVDANTSALLDRIKPGGVCMFARNIRDAVQVRALNDGIRKSLSVEPFLSIDQEGGLVDRLRRILGPMPAASVVSKAEHASAQAAIISGALRMLGFNMDFAPVVDVITTRRARFQNGLHSRAYGETAEAVIEIAGAFLTTLQADGVIGCLKHFPGLGASEVDSHEELPTVVGEEAEFDAVDLKPYRALIGNGAVKSVMVAHAAYPNLRLQEKGPDGKLLPSSLSSAIVTDLLRKEIGFDGMVMTDDLEMGAIVKNYGIGEASVMAILAGHDMVCICAGAEAIIEAHTAVSNAVEEGRIPLERVEISNGRILKLKSEVKPPLDLDLDRISALADQVAQLSRSLS